MGGAAARLAKECWREKCKLNTQRRLLAIRVEKKAKCFNDPSKDVHPTDPDKTKQAQEERAGHDTAIKETRDAIGNTKGFIGKNCR